MNTKLILGAVLLLAARFFSVHNAGAVDVTCLAWKFPVSPALIIFCALAAGLIGGWAITSALRRQSLTPGTPSAP